MANQLEQLKAMTVVSADTADLDAFAELQPHDATTNPTFIAAIAPDPKYAHLVRARHQPHTRSLPQYWLFHSNHEIHQLTNE